MHSSRLAAIVAAALVTFAFAYSGCSGPPPMGGSCEVSDDCQSNSQYVAESHCVEGVCKCRAPDDRICCAKGEEGPDCYLQCLPCAECGYVLGVTDGGCPTITPECTTDGDCPGPLDPRCGSGKCIEGECQLQIHSGPLTSQRQGDCARAECSPTGAVVEVADTSDAYNDGEQCTTDRCDGSHARNEPLADGTLCPEAGAGVCVGGRCAACWDLGWSQTCGPTLACDGRWCVPGHCVNTTFDPNLGETGQNCGGPCRPCAAGDSCKVGTDCYAGVCSMGTCQVPSCFDGVYNDTETGTDCGAPSCPLCAVGEGCLSASDCTSAVCWAGVCQAPTCSDGMKNGSETGIDCGPACQATCP